MSIVDFQFRFSSSKECIEVFNYIANPKNWWIGLFNEKIDGESKVLNDEFTFRAGDGAHYSKQKLVELETDRKIVWLVMESNLSFLENTNEWTGTTICYDIISNSNKTNIIFTHFGLSPKIECFDACSNAWIKYLQNLKEQLE